jgi:hypothetical protein
MYYSFKLHLYLYVYFFMRITVLIRSLQILIAGTQEKDKANCSIDVEDVITHILF